MVSFNNSSTSLSAYAFVELKMDLKKGNMNN